MPRPYPYNLSWGDMSLEPSSAAMSDKPFNLLEEIGGMIQNSPPHSNGAVFSPSGITNEELLRILDAALGLAMKLTLDPDYNIYTRGQILTMAIDTALIWERG